MSNVKDCKLEDLPETFMQAILQTPLGRLLDTLERIQSTNDSSNLVNIAVVVLDDPAIGRYHRRGRLAAIESAVIGMALQRTHGNVSAAARAIGVNRKTLERKIRRHKITTKAMS